jgi:hypothetical protein
MPILHDTEMMDRIIHSIHKQWKRSRCSEKVVKVPVIYHESYYVTTFHSIQLAEKISYVIN